MCLSFFLHFRIPHFLKTACKTQAEQAKCPALEILHELLKVASTSFENNKSKPV